MGLIHFITSFSTSQASTPLPDDIDWILENGVWDDTENWNDSQTWID